MICKHLTKNIALELGLHKWHCDTIISTDFNIRTKGDHRGFYYHISIGKYIFEFNIFDIRHKESEEAIG